MNGPRANPAADYRCVYRGNLALEPRWRIFAKSTAWSTGPEAAPSTLCDSDILLVNQGGKQTAYYVEAEKFQELPDSFAAQLPQQDKPEKNKHKHEFER